MAIGIVSATETGKARMELDLDSEDEGIGEIGYLQALADDEGQALKDRGGRKRHDEWVDPKQRDAKRIAESNKEPDLDRGRGPNQNSGQAEGGIEAPLKATIAEALTMLVNAMLAPTERSKPPEMRTALRERGKRQIDALLQDVHQIGVAEKAGVAALEHHDR